MTTRTFSLLMLALVPTTPPLAQEVTLQGHKSPVWCLAFSPDGRTLATGGRSPNVFLWEVSTRKLRGTLDDKDGVTRLAFSPDGKTLAGGYRAVQTWDITTGELRVMLKEAKVVHRPVSYSNDGRILASAAGENEGLLWDAAKGAEAVRLRGHIHLIFSLVFSPDGRTVATGSHGKIKLWETCTGEERASFSLEEEATVESLSFSPDGETLASGGWDGIARLWDVAEKKERRRFRHKDVVFSVAFTPDGKTLATGCNDKTVRLWDVDSGEERACVRHSGGVLSVAFSPDGKWLAVGGGNIVDNSEPNEVKLWDVKKLLN